MAYIQIWSVARDKESENWEPVNRVNFLSHDTFLWKASQSILM